MQLSHRLPRKHAPRSPPVPAGNGIELGCFDDTFEFLKQHGEQTGWL